MLARLIGVLLAAAPVRAAVTVLPRVDFAPALSPAAAAVPAAGAFSFSAAPSFGLSMAPALPVGLAPSPAAAPALSAAPAALAPTAAPALSALVPAAAPSDGDGRPSAERASRDASTRFDGAGAARDGLVAEPPADAPSPDGPGWSRGSFVSADGETPIVYKRRSGPAGAAPRVHFGGLALNESFDALFAAAPPARDEYFAWTRGHAPSGWTSAPSPMDADARDLARMIVVAAKESGAKKVELALHSFGTVVFQRMLQLRAEPEVRAALRLLTDSRVVLLNGMTHYDHVERLGGPAVERLAQANKMLVAWLDSWDAIAARWEAAARLNPFLIPQAEAWLAGYRLQRNELLAQATSGAVTAMRRDLAARWPANDPIRVRMLKDLDRDRGDPAWQEALLRRSNDAFVLDFKETDAKFLRRLGTRVDLVHASKDALLDWSAARLIFGRFGVPTPADAPPAGTELTDASGRVRATVVDADHYYPLKDADDLSRRLDRP